MSNTGQFIYQDLKSTIKAGDVRKLQTLLDEWRADPKIPGPTSSDINNLFPRAAEGPGQPVILEYLFSQGASTDIDDYTIGVTQSPEIFEIYIKKGWKVSQRLLHSHVQYPQLVKLFLANGANADPNITRGYKPLETAALRAPLESVRLLLAHGARIEPESRAMNAAARGDVPDRIPIMELLLDHGAEINALAEDYPAQHEPKVPGRKGTPLHSAAKWDNKEAMAWLLEHGADPTVRNEIGETAEEWGKRFDREGTDRILRIRRDILRKNTQKRNDKESG